MSALRILVISVLALTVIPMPTAQANSCSGLTQSRTVAGNTATVLIQNCEDSYTYGTYTQRSLTNDTRVTVDTTQNYRVVIDAYNSWYHYADTSSGQEATYHQHYYQVYFYDTTGTHRLPSGSLTGDDGQQTDSTYGCFEAAGLSANANSRDGDWGEGQDAFMGNGSDLPCTSSDVQNALP